jgi:hypothetical protein
MTYLAMIETRRVPVNPLIRHAGARRHPSSLVLEGQKTGFRPTPE